MSDVSNAIQAVNLSAQLQYRGAGNPPSALPSSAISNAFPGLEMDFRNIWKRIFVGIELHEASTLVVDVDADQSPELRALKNAYRLVKVGDSPVMMPVTGPRYGGGPENESLSDTTLGDKQMSLEWSNALAAELAKHAGSSVLCSFESLATPARTETFMLQMRSFFEATFINGKPVKKAVIARDIAPPGALTQSLCSPWQNDYRECACFYWAATRPDYVNVEPRSDGTSAGNNWMQKDRMATTPRHYISDDWVDPAFISYGDLFQQWELVLRFVFGGVDEPPLTPSKDEPI